MSRLASRDEVWPEELRPARRLINREEDWIKGPLVGVAQYGLSGVGALEAADSLSIAPDLDSTYYLIRYQECGSYGNESRDGALP